MVAALDEKQIEQLQWDGFAQLDNGMPEWELCRFVERLHKRYYAQITKILEESRDDWNMGDDSNGLPNGERPGSLVAQKINEAFKGAGIFVYAAHPSQEDEAEDTYDYSGPRWYVSVMEAVMKRFEAKGVVPHPPEELRVVVWPRVEDRIQPWLTEIGWTIVPEDSASQVMHADICCSEASNPRTPGQARYLHFAWKTEEGQVCTTNIVPGAFTEGCSDWSHYNSWKKLKAPAIIFDSEVLHRGDCTSPGVGWSSTFTLQICSGTGWHALPERVAENMLWYTQPFGWSEGDAVDVLVDGEWCPAIVLSRSESGIYIVQQEGSDLIAECVEDSNLRDRQSCAIMPLDHDGWVVGQRVESLFGGQWYPAKVEKRNGDGSYRVVWMTERTFTDGVSRECLRPMGGLPTHCAAQQKGILEDVVIATSTMRGDSDEHKKEFCLTKEIYSELLSAGYFEMPGGLPESWREWEMFKFVELYHDSFYEVIIRELENLRDVWEPCEGSHQRYGAFAAAKVSELLKSHGIVL